MDFFNAYIDLVTRSEFLDNCVFSNRHVLNLDEIMDLSVYHEDNMLVLCPADTERATMASYNGRLDVGDDPDEIDFMLEDAQHFVPTPNPENEDELATRLAAAVAQHVVGPAVRPLPEGEYEVARNYQSINFAIMFGNNERFAGTVIGLDEAIGLVMAAREARVTYTIDNEMGIRFINAVTSNANVRRNFTNGGPMEEHVTLLSELFEHRDTLHISFRP